MIDLLLLIILLPIAILVVIGILYFIAHVVGSLIAGLIGAIFETLEHVGKIWDTMSKKRNQKVKSDK